MKKDYELSNISYTNKDFFDVYPELLQLAKRLSAKWDPTVSNESDPGVVLIKELALITDKINYIADKYALENNPRSVTQIENARQLYNLLGYYPEWYESAKVDLSLYWDGDKQENTYITIPKFTSVQDADGEFVYTTLADITLPMDGSYASGDVEAIEGTYNRLVVNNSDILTLSMLSDDQRIYIDTYNVATNGIFITDSTGTIPWTRVNNINVLESYTRSYSFNVDIVTGQCYIQFPRDIAYLIGDGLIIHYITSKGAEGNIPINHLSKLTVTTLTTTDTDGNDISVDTTDIVVTNTGNTYRGKDPVGIDQMYENWKHIAGTFDTLVTLRDYNNAIRRYPDLASNGFVCDRTNDVQLSYKVMQGTPLMPTTKTKIEKYPIEDDDFDTSTVDWNRDGEVDAEEDVAYLNEIYKKNKQPDRLSAYDLKLYCLQSFPYENIDNYTDYDSTFELYSDVDMDITDSDTKHMVDALSTFKCISHDYHLPEANKICFLKNKYNVDLQILPNQELTSLQAIEVKRNICRAIYNQFNSSKVEFGEQISYDDLLECIKNSDSRIKTAILDRLVYDTYAVFYINNGTINWFEVPVSDDAYNEFINDENTLFKIKSADGYEEYAPMWKDPWKRAQARNYAELFRTEIVAKNILAGITPYIIDVGGGYPYSFNHKSLFNEDIIASHVKTNLHIDMKFTSKQSVQSIELAENEVIQFSKPNLLDLRTYGAYIYYEYSGTPVEHEKDYELKANEYIIFFYKEADKDSKYRFDMYGPGTIIHPTFNLDDNVSDIGAKAFGDKRPSQPGEALIAYRALESTRQYYGLSVNDSVVIKKVNQIRLPKEDSAEAYIYFVTNKKENNKYLLEFNEDGRRILEEGEFFIYTNSSKTSLDILGAGTEIKWIGKTDPVTLRCDYTDVSDIALYGSSAIRGKWLTIKDPVILYVIEKAFTNALEGNTVTFTIDKEFDYEDGIEFILDSDGLHAGADYLTYSMYAKRRINETGSAEEDIPAIPKVEAVAHNGITASENLADFLEIMYDGSIRQTSNADSALLECRAIRVFDEEDTPETAHNLFAWKCVGKDGQTRWIYDRRTFEYLFYDSDGNFSEDKLNEYRDMLGINDDDSVAGVGTLTTIEDMSDVIAGDDGDDHEDESPADYQFTDEEKEAFVSWYSIFSVKSNVTSSYLQYYIDYEVNGSFVSDEELPGALIHIDYTYTLADDDAPLNRFSKIEIDGTEVEFSPSDSIATETHAYLNIDLGPDKPQVFRAKKSSYPYIIDQIIFYKDGSPIGEINTDIAKATDTTVYANVNVYGQGSSDLIDVTYYDEHLLKKSPIFYSYVKIEPALPTSEDTPLFTEAGTESYINFTKDPSGTDVHIFKEKSKLTAGNYIVRIAHSNYSLSNLVLKYGSTEIKEMGTGITNIAEPGTYFMTFTSDGSEQYITVTYSLKNTTPVSRSQMESNLTYKYGDVYRVNETIPPIQDELPNGVPANYYVIAKRDHISGDNNFYWSDWSVSPYPLYSLAISEVIKYESASGKQDYYTVSDSQVYNKIVELDYDNEFNYLYEVPELKLIKNPLKATSFLNVNHVYNPFTICESKLPDILV